MSGLVKQILFYFLYIGALVVAVMVFRQADVYICTYNYAPSLPSNGVIRPVCVLDNGSVSEFCTDCRYQGRVVMTVVGLERYSNNRSIFSNSSYSVT